MTSNMEFANHAYDTPGPHESPPRYKEFKRVVSVFFGRPLPIAGLIIIILFLFIAVFAPWLAPHDPYEMNVLNKLQPPTYEHLLGTDNLGRDTLSRVIYGSQTSLIIAFSSSFLSIFVGVSLGLLAAYSGGIVHHIIMRITDGLMAFPMILLALLIASLLGGGITSVIMALTVGMISPNCRITCGIAMSIKENDYVLAARSMGERKLFIMVKEILPNCFAPILVTMTIGIGATILAEASLSFLGVGVNPPIPVWGRMISDGYKYLIITPVLSFAPGFAIMLVVFGFNMLGDGLRDALDPRLRGII